MESKHFRPMKNDSTCRYVHLEDVVVVVVVVVAAAAAASAIVSAAH